MFLGPNMMSLSTVSSKSWYSGYWNTMPTWKRTARIFLGSAQMSLPFSSTWPEVGRSRPLSIWMRVDLPLPVWPITPRNSPFSTWMFTPSTAVFSKGVPGL